MIQLTGQTTQSTKHAHYLREIRNRKYLVWCTQLAILATFIGCWEWFTRMSWLDSFLFSSPSLIIHEMKKLMISGELFHHIGVTTLETIIGFTLGTLLGITLAALLWYSSFLSKVMSPFLVVLNSLPKVALGPFFIITMGAGFSSILAMAIAITIIITTLVIYTAFENVEESHLILARSFGATRSQLLQKIVLPSCIPEMIAALKVNVGLAWVGVIVGEFLVSKAGLGYLIIYGFQVFNLHLVMVSLFIIAIETTIMYQLIIWLENRIAARTKCQI